ncbi:hypothetical protein [Legionella brunensis]|uniref:hypothetical protein n=1 Tax=Legionella brunensis TaxID=29422 RepID=UPI0013EF7485|nr:hypothetical protein [Legionella brunensis]
MFTLFFASMLDNLGSFFLLFGNGAVIIPIIALGFICLDRKLFYQTACLLAFSMIMNVALKISFQVPLPAALGKGWYAFPSGHMQMATVFYGWLAYKIGIPWFRGVVVILLLGISFSLIHFNYHNVYDIAGALFFALWIMVLYQFLLSRWPRNFPFILLIMAICLLCYIDLIYGKIPLHAWLAFGVLLTLVVAKMVYSKKKNNEAINQ